MRIKSEAYHFISLASIWQVLDNLQSQNNFHFVLHPTNGESLLIRTDSLISMMNPCMSTVQVLKTISFVSKIFHICLLQGFSILPELDFNNLLFQHVMFYQNYSFTQ